MLDDDPSRIPTKSTTHPTRIPTKQKELIINTLINLKNNGKAENTITSVNRNLTRISKHADLSKPEQVKQYIANATRQDNGKPLSNATKNKMVFCYQCLCNTHNLQWTPPKFKWEETIPIIPTKANVEKIITASTKRYATIFTILAETGAEGQELHNVHRKDIDTEQGIISITGTKGHASGNYKLKAKTAEMLREYLAKNPQNQPFPKPHAMAETWRTIRDRLADNLKQPELKKIPMKNLRNYSGAQFYLRYGKDPIQTMRHLRHKKLQTTMHYLRAIVTDSEEEYIAKATKDMKEALELIELGYQFVDEMDGYKLYRKRK